MKWGPTGELVYNRTYSRTLPDGRKESWPETVERVVDGNLALVDSRHHLPGERDDLIRLMTDFKILPGGRHLWASGVPNAQHLFNCWVAGWDETPASHFSFTFTRLMEGGGVGANYSNSLLDRYPPVAQDLIVDVVCDPEHPDYQQMLEEGLLSNDYHPDWMGAYQVEDSREGWAAALTDLIETHYRDEVKHFHRVYDVSRVRAAGTRLRTFGGRASGPLPLARMLRNINLTLSELAYTGLRLDGLSAMEIDHAIAQCVVAGGVRRSARMSMMHWKDPDIHQFINCKSDSGLHWTTNISVIVDEEFWSMVQLDTPEDQRLFAQREAFTILRVITEGMTRNGEPGIWDIDRSNVGEPNGVICTNPCGEITLEAWEPCNLGHVNLEAFVNEDGRAQLTAMHQAHTLMARFLMRATFSEVADPKSREVLDRNRRIGLGHFGTAGFLALTGQKYSEVANNFRFQNMLIELKETVDAACVQYAHDLRIPVPVKRTTVAPTGTIAKMPGVSEGIHPPFAKFFIRRVRFNKLGDDMNEVEQLKLLGHVVEDDLYAANTVVVELPTAESLFIKVAELRGLDEAHRLVQAADDLSLSQLLDMQAVYQQYWADNAVSFTANVDPDRYTAESVAEVTADYGGRVKGFTIFPEASFPQAPYERITEKEFNKYQHHQLTVADSVDEDCASGACPIR